MKFTRRKKDRMVVERPPSPTEHGKLKPTAVATRESHVWLRLLVRHMIRRGILDHAARKPDATATDKRKALNNRKNASRLRSRLVALGPEMRERACSVTDAFTSSAGSLLLSTLSRSHVDTHDFAMGAGELFFDVWDQNGIRHAGSLALAASFAQGMQLANMLRANAWTLSPATLTTSRTKQLDADTTSRLAPGDALRLAAMLEQTARGSLMSALALEAQSREAAKAATGDERLRALLAPDSGGGVLRGDGPRGCVDESPSPETSPSPEPEPDDEDRERGDDVEVGDAIDVPSTSAIDPLPRRASEADKGERYTATERRLSVEHPSDPAAAAYQAMVAGMRSRPRFP
jgi:hypothetical protein